MLKGQPIVGHGPGTEAENWMDALPKVARSATNESILGTVNNSPSLNSDYDWDAFDSGWYSDHNYATLRFDDRQIVEVIRDFFASAGVIDGRGVDVGPGANLYPSLAMLPFCRRLDLLEYSASNVVWLKGQVAGFDEGWENFWAVYRENPAYAALADPNAALAQAAEVRQASVFELPKREWDMGTMFFVACSLSTEIAEFRRAVRCFVESLKPGGPFAAAFMVKSTGYKVGETWFPAVPIDPVEAARSLESIAYNVRVHEIETDSPLRDGYEGMILATGWAAG